MKFEQTSKTGRQSPGAHEQALRQAIFALQNGRPQEAEWLAADVLKRSPTEPRALQIFGYALLQQGKAADAVVPLKRAAIRTHDPEIETQYALALQQSGKDEEAIEQLGHAISRRPPFPPAFLAYASLLSFLDRNDEAISVLKDGQALIPKVPELSSLLGDIFMSKRDHSAARAAYSAALEHSPVHPDALFGLGRALQAEGDFAQAADVFRRMMAGTSDVAAANIGLGNCLLELGQPDAAFAAFRTAARTSAKMCGETVAVLAMSRRGRFWIRPSDASRVLRSDGS